MLVVPTSTHTLEELASIFQGSMDCATNPYDTHINYAKRKKRRNKAFFLHSGMTPYPREASRRMVMQRSKAWGPSCSTAQTQQVGAFVNLNVQSNSPSHQAKPKGSPPEVQGGRTGTTFGNLPGYVTDFIHCHTNRKPFVPLLAGKEQQSQKASQSQ